MCTNDGTEGNKAVTFLDLDICILGNKLAFSTHRKPLASYAYTPFDSNHSSATLLGIVATEAVRLLRTNNSQHTFDKQRCFFIGKLKLRGFDIKQVRRILAKYPWSAREKLLMPTACRSSKKTIVPLKLPYSPSIPKLDASAVFRSHEHLLPDNIRAQLRPLVAMQTAPNLFRLRYSRFC